jgi:hypothetical protein
MKRLILTVMMIMITTIVVGCGKDNAQTTNDLLYRETNEVHKVSEISQYL